MTAFEGTHGPTLIGNLNNLLQILLQDLQCAQFFLLVLDDWLRGDHLLWHPGCNKHIIFLADFNSTLLGIELADAHSIARLLQIKLFRLALGKFDDIQPGDVRRFFTMRLEYTRRAVKQALETLDQDGSQRTCAEVTRDTFVAMKYAVIFAD